MMFQITSSITVIVSSIAKYIGKVKYDKEDDNGLFKCLYISK